MHGIIFFGHRVSFSQFQQFLYLAVDMYSIVHDAIVTDIGGNSHIDWYTYLKASRKTILIHFKRDNEIYQSCLTIFKH